MQITSKNAQCCFHIHNKEYEGAALYSRTAYEMVFYSTDGIIPSGQREDQGSYWLARATYHLAKVEGISPEESRGGSHFFSAASVLDIHSRLHRTENIVVAHTMTTLATY